MVFFGKRSRGEWVKEINQQCVWFVQLNFATYVGVSFSKRKLIYSPINLGFHLLIARIVLYCFLLFTVYYCKCYNKRGFNLQNRKNLLRTRFRFHRRIFFKWWVWAFFHVIYTVNPVTKRFHKRFPDGIQFLCVKRFFLSCKLNRRLLYHYDRIK